MVFRGRYLQNSSAGELTHAGAWGEEMLPPGKPAVPAQGQEGGGRWAALWPAEGDVAGTEQPASSSGSEQKFGALKGRGLSRGLSEL